MTQTEALKLALEALENILKNDGGQGSECYSAIRLFDARETGYKTITAIKEALAQPEQEPVAWLDSDGFPWSKQGIECRTTKDTYTPLYTTPPQRKPLTDEEIDYWIGSNSTKKALARAIEAAHGIKGEA